MPGLYDHFALVGDVVDGVPGVESVGTKSATKVLLEHGALEGMLAATAA
jgi:DNA polymerase-1